MCGKAPKVQAPQEKPPQYLRNPYLDGLTINAQGTGRNSLRIDPGTPTYVRPPQPIKSAPRAAQPGLVTFAGNSLTIR